MATGKKVSLKSYVSMYNFSFERNYVNRVINEMKVWIITVCSAIDCTAISCGTVHFCFQSTN